MWLKRRSDTEGQANYKAQRNTNVIVNTNESFSLHTTALYEFVNNKGTPLQTKLQGTQE